MKKPFAILVDTISTIGSNNNPNIADVFVLPLGLTDSNGTYYDDYTSGITIDTLLKAAEEKKYFKTSSTKVKTFFNVVDKILQNYDTIIYLALSSGLSSQYDTLNKIVQTYDEYKDHIWLFDSLAAGYSVEKMVQQLLLRINNNEKITPKVVQSIIKEENNSCEEYIVCKNLLGATQGGRLKRGIANIFNKLHFVPIIQFEKTNGLKTVCASYDNAVRKIIAYVKQRNKKENKHISEVCAVSLETNKEEVKNWTKIVCQEFNVAYDSVQFRNMMLPVAAHTLFDTFCFYFKFKSN